MELLYKCVRTLTCYIFKKTTPRASPLWYHGWLPSFQLRGRSAIERGDSENCPPKHLTWIIAATLLNITTFVMNLLLIIWTRGGKMKNKQHFKALKRLCLKLPSQALVWQTCIISNKNKIYCTCFTKWLQLEPPIWEIFLSLGHVPST